MSRRDELMERIRSEAKAHESGCDCRTCRAASGDDAAKRALLRELL